MAKELVKIVTCVGDKKYTNYYLCEGKIRVQVVPSFTKNAKDWYKLGLLVDNTISSNDVTEVNNYENE